MLFSTPHLNLNGGGMFPGVLEPAEDEQLDSEASEPDSDSESRHSTNA